MTPTKTRPHKPMLAEWTSEILSLSLSSAKFEDQVPLISNFLVAHLEQALPCPEAFSAQDFHMVPAS